MWFTQTLIKPPTKQHSILITKMRSFGVSESLILLFISYLRVRESRVKYHNFESDYFTPTSELPQGSNLGPPLLLLFISDLPEIVDCEKLLFANDLQLFHLINSTHDREFRQRSAVV